MRPLLLVTCLLSTASYAAPILVTDAEGEVLVVRPGQMPQKIEAPFSIEEGWALELRGEARAVVLSEVGATVLKGAQRLDNPAKMGLDDEVAESVVQLPAEEASGPPAGGGGAPASAPAAAAPSGKSSSSKRDSEGSSSKSSRSARGPSASAPSRDVVAGIIGDRGAPTDAALGALLSREELVPSVTPSRAVGVQLVRPPPASVGAVTQIRELRWTCPVACPPAKVVVRDVRTDVVMWEGSGAGATLYGGTSLAPGSYMIEIGEDAFTAKVGALDPSLSKALDLAVLSMESADRASQVSVRAGALVAAGLAGAAMNLLDTEAREDASVARVRDSYARRLGLM